MRYLKRTIVLGAVAGMLFGCSGVSEVTDGDPAEMTAAEAKGELEETKEAGAEQLEEGRDQARVRSKLESVTRAPHRSSDDQERDEYRNPIDTLLFFDLDTDQTVVELYPGAGWYTEIIGPVVANDGALVAGMPHLGEDAEGLQRDTADQFHARLDRHGDVLGDITVGTFSPGDVVDLGPSGSADLVVTFRNFHTLYNHEVLEEGLQAVHRVLKPGGVFGVVAHRAPEQTEGGELANDGYLPQEYVIELVEEAGFVLEETSEINANPEDTADHPHGVWSLPPTLRGDEDTAEQFEEIGESDRMTLRFVKAAPDERRQIDDEGRQVDDDKRRQVDD